MLFVFSLLLSSNAQTKSKDIELIKDNPEYYWGMSQVVESQDEAMNASLQSLYSNIANKCNADAIFATNLDPMLFLENIIKTFDNKIQQKIVEQIPLVEDFEDDQYSYFVYIKRSDFEAMCDERKKSIERLALRGYNCENDDNLQIEDALRNYYWGLMLCVAHPHGNSITLKIDDEEVNAYNWLIDRIGGSDGVLNSFTFRLPKEAEIEETPEGLLLCLNVRSTTGMPVMNLQFDYYNGQKYIPAYVNDGKSNIIIRPDRDVISIRIEYQFKTESTVDPDVYKVLHNLNHNIKFDNKLIVNIENIKKEYENRIASIEEQPAIEDSVAVEEDVLIEEEVDIVKKEWRKIDNKFDLKDPDYMQIMKDVENAIRSKNYLSVKHHFTDEQIRFSEIPALEFRQRLIPLIPEIPGKLVITCSSFMTFELIQLCSEKGYVCGVDYQLVSYDNLRKSMQIPAGIPEITSIDYSRTAAAKTAAKLLIHSVRNPHSVGCQTIKFPTQLRIKESAFQNRKDLILS